MLQAFFHGLILALGLILPLGLQNIYLFNQGANQPSFKNALPSIITAIVCDATLIVCAVLGVTLVILAMPRLEIFILLIGFVFLLYMGFAAWVREPLQAFAGKQPLSARKQVLFTASVSLLNPHALLDSIGVIGTNSIRFLGMEKVAFMSACIMVSTLWFFGLTFAGHSLKKLDKQGGILAYLNKVSALLIWSVAAYIGWLCLQQIIKGLADGIISNSMCYGGWFIFFGNGFCDGKL